MMVNGSDDNEALSLQDLQEAGKEWLCPSQQCLRSEI